jgi:beta-galactosidase GanA
VDEEGRRAEHGNRQQFNFANARYRELARKIAEPLAMRFGHPPYVLGWQIDNEYSDISFDPDTKAQFRQWLKAVCQRHLAQLSEGPVGGHSRNSDPKQFITTNTMGWMALP